MPAYIQVVTTTALREEAERIARELVEARLAACVQIVGPIISTYRWQGKIEAGEEWQCWAKTRGELFARVEEAIRRIHPYEVPEILAVPVVAGSANYLAWLDAETRCSYSSMISLTSWTKCGVFCDSDSSAAFLSASARWVYSKSEIRRSVWLEDTPKGLQPDFFGGLGTALALCRGFLLFGFGGAALCFLAFGTFCRIGLLT